jgi:hypothetical protein
VIYLEHTRSACTSDLHQPTKSQKEKKRKGMDALVQPQPQFLFAIFSVGKKKAQNCLKAYNREHNYKAITIAA